MEDPSLEVEVIDSTSVMPERADSIFWVTVSISDTGIEMPGEVQKHIFEKFYQGDASHSTYGTGLGLALAKRITDLHGGSISVRSAPGEGSCFSVRLPVQPASRRLCAKSGQS